MSNKTSNDKRIFIVVPLEKSTQDELSPLQHRLWQRFDDWIRIIPVGDIHLTMHFLGECNVERIASAIEAIKAAAGEISAGNLTIDGLGGFPDTGKLRVIVADVGSEKHVLHQAWYRISHFLQKQGFATEAQFSPHITLARTRKSHRPGQIREELDSIKFEPISQTFDELALVESELLPHGAKYHELFRVKLGGGRA